MALRSLVCACVLVFELFLVGGAAAQTDTVTYVHSDGIGSVRMVTSETGQIVARYDYFPFGEVCSQSACGNTPSTVTTRQFAGKERDSETGLDYFGGRYLTSGSGRFTTIDPVLDVERALMNPQRWNRYSYALNSPFAYVDPDGRELYSVVNGRVVAGPGNMQADFRQFAVGAGLLVGTVGVAIGGPIAWRAAMACLYSAICQSTVIGALQDAAGGPPSIGGNVGRLSEAEFATGQRLAQKLGQAVRVSEHEGAEFISVAGKTYDAMGAPAAYKFWNEKAFLTSIDKHLRKSNNYTVIDLTGANRAQIDAIRQHVGSLASELQERIIYVGQ
jgi:RHS repeat-associated protein